MQGFSSILGRSWGVGFFGPEGLERLGRGQYGWLNARIFKHSGAKLGGAEREEGNERKTGEANRRKQQEQEAQEAQEERKEEEEGAACANENENPPQVEWWEKNMNNYKKKPKMTGCRTISI